MSGQCVYGGRNLFHGVSGVSEKRRAPVLILVHNPGEEYDARETP